MSLPLPVTLASVITAAFSAGGGMWLANPANKALVLNKLEYVHAQIGELEAEFGAEAKEEALSGTPKQQKPKFQDPRLWVAIIALLVVLVTSIISYFAWKKHHDAQITGHLWVRPVRGIKLKDMDSDTLDKGDVTDAFIDVRVGNQHHRTKTVKNSLNPDWSKEQMMEFEVNMNSSKPEDKIVKFEVKDDDGILHKSDLVGHAEVEISTFVKNSKMLTKTVPLLDYDSGKKGTGQLAIEGQYVPIVSRGLVNPGKKKEVGCCSVQ